MKDSLPLHPPRWPLRLLRYFLKEEYLEEIEGDMEEVFRENAERLSVSKARRRYTLDMLGLLRPSLMRNVEFLRSLGHLPIFRNYVKVSVRGLQRHPLNSFINLFGLAAAIAFCVFAYTYARWTFKRDQFHENKHTVFLTTFYSNREGGHFQYGLAPRPLAEQLKQDFAQVKQTCRVGLRPGLHAILWRCSVRTGLSHLDPREGLARAVARSHFSFRQPIPNARHLKSFLMAIPW